MHSWSLKYIFTLWRQKPLKEVKQVTPIYLERESVTEPRRNCQFADGTSKAGGPSTSSRSTVHKHIVNSHYSLDVTCKLWGEDILCSQRENTQCQDDGWGRAVLFWWKDLEGDLFVEVCERDDTQVGCLSDSRGATHRCCSLCKQWICESQKSGRSGETLTTWTRPPNVLVVMTVPAHRLGWRMINFEELREV